MGNYQIKINNLIKYTCSTFENNNAEDVQSNAQKLIKVFCKVIILYHYKDYRGNRIISSQDDEWNRKFKVTSDQQRKKCEFALSMLLKVVIETSSNKISKSKKIDLQRTIELIIFKGNSLAQESSPIKMDSDDTLITQKSIGKLLRWLFLEFLQSEIPDRLIVYIGLYDIFLSYRHTDIEWVKVLESNLKAQGYTIFRDEYQMIAGEKIRQRLYDAINKSSCGILIYPIQDDSKWIKEEIEWMRERQRKDASFKIIPVVMHTSEHLPDENILYIDFTQKTYETSFNKLICSIKGIPPLKNHIQEELKLPQKILFPLCLEQPIGTVPLESRYYIQRKVDKRCHDILKSKYTLIRIKAPSQYGKTSLLTRLISQAKQENYRIVYFNFQEFDKSLLSSINQLLEFICDIIAFELDIEITLNPRIAKRLTPKTKATKQIQKILSKINKPLVLAIDEADRLFDYEDVSDEFFSLIRAWHEYAKSDPLWENLKILLSHSTEPLLGIKNINQSPFHNVGLGVELKPFNSHEIKELAQRHNISLRTQEVEKFISFLGGHPYLSRNTLYAIATESKSLTNIIDEAYTSKSIFKKHMQRYLLLIKENPQLLKVLHEILQNKRNIDERQCYILEATGLINDTMGSIKFSCQLYHEFFQQRL